MDAEKHATWVDPQQANPRSINIRRCRLEVVAGPDTGKVVELAQPTIVIGRTGGDLTISDPMVSALHCEIALTPHGYHLRDLGSTNGTHVRGVRIVDGYLGTHATIGLGESAVVFDPLDDAVQVPLWHDDRLCSLIGASSAMRQLFETIDRIARSDSTVLIEGETGCGKELVADAIHLRSPRARGPFQVLDCSAIADTLFEDQLFGHEAGAFTGANATTIGVFEAAHRGTLFLDEVGELPLDIQTKLLRCVESRRIRRIGGSDTIACDVRIVAATNRNLAREVNRGTFRADLYYRLAVARILVPPLRERRDDIPLLVDHFARTLDPTGANTVSEDFLSRAKHHSWPGNVRELRNAVERNLRLPFAATFEQKPAATIEVGEVNADAPFKVAKQAMVDEFERKYITRLLDLHNGNITSVARAAGIERMTIYKMIRRLGID